MPFQIISLCELLICNCTCLWIYRINSAVVSYVGYVKPLNQATWQLQFLKWPILFVTHSLSCSSAKQNQATFNLKIFKLG